MKLTKIAVVVLLGILLMTGTACDLRRVSRTVEMPPQFEGILRLEVHHQFDSTAFEAFVIEGLMWNMGEETIYLTYEVYFYDSKGSLLDVYWGGPNDILPFDEKRFYAWTTYDEQVASYKVVFAEEPPR